MSAETKTEGKQLCFLGTLDPTHGAWDRPDALCPRCRPTIEAGGPYHPEFLVEMAAPRIHIDPGNVRKVLDALLAGWPERREAEYRDGEAPDPNGDPVVAPWFGGRSSSADGRLCEIAGFGPEELQSAAVELARIEETVEGHIREMATAARLVVNHAAGVLNQVAVRLGHPQVSGTAELGLVHPRQGDEDDTTK